MPPKGVAVKVNPVEVVEGLKDSVLHQLGDFVGFIEAETLKVGELVPLSLPFTPEAVAVAEGHREEERKAEGVASRLTVPNDCVEFTVREVRGEGEAQGDTVVVFERAGVKVFPAGILPEGVTEFELEAAELLDTEGHADTEVEVEGVWVRFTGVGETVPQVEGVTLWVGEEEGERLTVGVATVPTLTALTVTDRVSVVVEVGVGRVVLVGALEGVGMEEGLEEGHPVPLRADPVTLPEGENTPTEGVGERVAELEEEPHTVGETEVHMEGAEVGVLVTVPALPSEAEEVPEEEMVEEGEGAAAVPVVVGQALRVEVGDGVGVEEAEGWAVGVVVGVAVTCGVLLSEALLQAVGEAEALLEGVEEAVVQAVADCRGEALELEDAVAVCEVVGVDTMVGSPTTVKLPQALPVPVELSVTDPLLVLLKAGLPESMGQEVGEGVGVKLFLTVCVPVVDREAVGVGVEALTDRLALREAVEQAVAVEDRVLVPDTEAVGEDDWVNDSVTVPLGPRESLGPLVRVGVSVACPEVLPQDEGVTVVLREGLTVPVTVPVTVVRLDRVLVAQGD